MVVPPESKLLKAHYLGLEKEQVTVHPDPFGDLIDFWQQGHNSYFRSLGCSGRARAVQHEEIKREERKHVRSLDSGVTIWGCTSQDPALVLIGRNALARTVQLWLHP